MIEKLDLSVFPYHQRYVISEMLEELERLRQRVSELERERDKTKRLWKPAYTHPETTGKGGEHA